ncbi:hypothetical protein O3P69_017528 [Scylla paramamosain]|uniref:Uncharacterized protein n=1 Tax=Scylla paramamosain TaxID=85552 RepID=A0AAW0TXE9_SCYPA
MGIAMLDTSCRLNSITNLARLVPGLQRQIYRIEITSFALPCSGTDPFCAGDPFRAATPASLLTQLGSLLTAHGSPLKRSAALAQAHSPRGLSDSPAAWRLMITMTSTTAELPHSRI